MGTRAAKIVRNPRVLLAAAARRLERLAGTSPGTATRQPPTPPAVRRPSPRGPLHHHQSLLPRRKDRVVVVLADDTLRVPLLASYLAGVPDDRVTVLGRTGTLGAGLDTVSTAPSEGVGDDVEWFVRNGPVDIVIDLREPKIGSRRPRWAQLFLYLRPKGVWIVPRQVAAGDLRNSERKWLIALATRTAVAGDPTSRSLDAESMRSVAGVTARAGIIVIEKQLTHVVKLRDHEVMTVLPRRDPQVDVTEIAVLPAQVFHSSARVVSHPAAVPITGLDTAIPVPRMAVRHYRGPIAVAGQTLMHTTNSVLPDSFRFYHALDEVRGGLANSNLFDFDARLSRVKPHTRPIESMPGDFFQLDAQYSGHFGHVMTETVARLWGWDAAKERLPDLKALLFAAPVPNDRVGDPTYRRAGLERALLQAYGIADDDIVLLERPTYVHSLVSATAMWHNWPPYFVHPAIGDTWRRIRDRIVDPDATVYDRIFVTRSAQAWRRRCVNGAEVEAFFEARGFTVLYPERFTIGEQAAMFAHASVVAGYGGSGLFSLLYARNLQTVIVINQEGYTARNEHLYTAVLGCEVHYFWSTPVHQQPETGWRIGAYESEFTFDFARNEKPLAQLLDSLGRG